MAKLKDGVIAFSEVIMAFLKTPTYDWPAKVMLAVERGSRMERVKIAVCAPNGAGESSHVVAVSALRWLYKNPKGKVVCTSADARQIDLQLMPAIVKHRSIFKHWEFLPRQIRIPQGGFFNAFTTDEPGRAEGHHAAPEGPLLIIGNEAKSIPPEIFDAIDRCSFNTLLLVSSPGLMAGRFYDAFSKDRAQWITFQIGLTDCPHISKERIEDVVATHGAESSYTRSTLYGEFMAEEEGTHFVVSLSSLQALLDSPPMPRPNTRERYAFCDFAAGGDENVIAIRSGNVLEKLICWRERDTMSAVGRFILEFRRAGLEASQIWGDDGGAGRPMIDAFAQSGWRINRFNFGSRANDELAYVSRGAEAWANFGRQVTTSEIVLIRDEVLISQLTTRKSVFDSRGRIGIEKKDDLRARGLHSPDRADAVVGVFGIRNAYAGNYTKQIGFVDSADPYTNWDGWGQTASLSSENVGLRRHLEDTGAWTG
jgi:phage terminase large subunit